MIVVIQCAGGKNPNAGCFMTEDDRPILFVADPKNAPEGKKGVVYKRPDDPAQSGRSYREELVKYNNRQPGDNPLGLLSACRLYRDPVYAELVDTFGTRNVFILSAGWGLIDADFLTPDYDITFRKGKHTEHYKFREKHHHYDDLSRLPANSTGPIVFLGGKDYVPLFCRLTKGAKPERIIFYYYNGRSDNPPDAPRCRLQRFETKKSTNWHYECAKALIRGDITV